MGPHVPPSVPRLLLMAECAIDTDLLSAMAIHAPAHANIRFAKQLIPFLNFAVAIGARIARRYMRPVAERDIRRNLVHPRPAEVTIVFGSRRQFLDGRTLRLDRGMARHALGRRSHGHHLAWIGIRMAHLTGQLQRTRMYFVAEGNRLLRRNSRRTHACNQPNKRADDLAQLHKALAFI